MLWLNIPDHILCTYIFHLRVSAQYRFKFRLVVDHFLFPISNFCRVLSCGMTRACKQLQFCRHDIAKVSNMLKTNCNAKNCIELRDKSRLCKRALKSPFLTICFCKGRLDPILMRHSFRKVPVFHAITTYAEKNSSLERVSESCVFGDRFHRIRVDGRRIRKEKFKLRFQTKTDTSGRSHRTSVYNNKDYIMKVASILGRRT